MSGSAKVFAQAAILVSILTLSTAQAQSVLYVDDDASAGGVGTSWATAYQHLQDALAAAAASGGTVTEIRVAGGTYRPDQGAAQTAGDPTAVFTLQNGLAVRGGHAGPGHADPDVRDFAACASVMNADLAGDDETGGGNTDNSYHLVNATNKDRTAVLDGFTLTGGMANVDVSSVQALGGGLIARPGSPTVMNCTFLRNIARSGAGAFCQGAPVFTDCAFRENHALSPSGTGVGGGLYCIRGDAELTRCTFIGNTTQYLGGGAHLREGAHVVTDCTFIENTASDRSPSYGGGMQLYDTNATVINSRFFGNVAGTGGGGLSIDWQGDPVIVNCVFIANRATMGGGGVFNWRNTTTFTNCTVVANDVSSTSLGGDGIYNSNDEGTVGYITNCILWNNGGTTSNSQCRRGTVTYSVVQGGWTGSGGTGIIDADPLFRRNPDPHDDGWGAGDDDDYGDVHLRPGSPCLDMGYNSVDVDRVLAGIQPLPDFDLDHLLRVVDEPIAPDGGTPPVVDMGAYEYQDDCNGNSVIDSVDLDSGTSEDCNNNGIPDECEPADDCNSNSVQDICDLASGAFSDCNENGLLDVCDIASGTSQDADTNGVPDECERKLTGYWRMGLTYNVSNCHWLDHLFDQVRYLRFDEDSSLMESWIQTADGQYIKLDYPSIDGPSLNRYMFAGELTVNTDRAVSSESLLPHPWTWDLVEIVVVNDESHDPMSETTPEDGSTTFHGRLDETGDRLTGTWSFSDSFVTFCGEFVANRLPGSPPTLPTLIDVEAADLQLSATALTRPGSVNVAERTYRVKSSFLDAPFEIRYLLSTDQVADASDAVLATEMITPGADGAMGLHTETGPALPIPECVPWGRRFFILMVVDRGDSLAETQEDNNVVSVAVTVHPSPIPGDVDGDCDVDADDVLAFVNCAAGPAVLLPDSACLVFDFDLDTDIDQSDFAVMQRCHGTHAPTDPDCIP